MIFPDPGASRKEIDEFFSDQTSIVLVNHIEDHHECFIVSMPENKRVVGGTCAEVRAFWNKHMKKSSNPWAQPERSRC